MSIRVMSQVWDKANVSENTLLTLLALADWSDDAGHSYPSLDMLARKSRQSVRNVHHCLKKLEKLDLVIAKLAQGRNGRNSFFLNMKIFHVSSDQTGNLRHSNMKFATPKHEICDTETCNLRQRNKEEPSLNRHRTVNEPQTETPVSGQNVENSESEINLDTVLDASQATTYVVIELGISGNQGRMRANDSVKSYMHKNKCSAKEAAESLVGLWRRYESIEMPYKKGLSKWFEDGAWSNPGAWGRRNGNGAELTKTQRRHLNNLRVAAEDTDAGIVDVDSGDARPGIDARRVKNMG